MLLKPYACLITTKLKNLKKTVFNAIQIANFRRRDTKFSTKPLKTENKFSKKRYIIIHGGLQSSDLKFVFVVKFLTFLTNPFVHHWNICVSYECCTFYNSALNAVRAHK